MIKGNKGEWSEMYVLLRLLGEGKIYAADSNLNRIQEIYFPIIKIIREEIKNEKKEYFTSDQRVKICVNGKEVLQVPVEDFICEADNLLLSIINGKNKGAFSVERTENFMNRISCYKISAPSTRKTDINMQIIDTNTGYSPVVGFSIKSELGHAPTLLNAGKTTNFVYEIRDSYDGFINETNAIYTERKGKQHIDVRGRVNNIVDKGLELLYVGMENSIFRDNLELIDSYMDRIISETLLYYYRDGIDDCKTMVKKLEEINPIGYGNINAYAYKFKKFLVSVALGMRPGTIWDGKDEANGGYIVVTREGGVLAYHIYNRDYFEEYLLNNTKYETASTRRHDFGKAYKENLKKYIKLNLQIRFIK